MHENTFSLVKYTLFWILVIVTKLTFSYYIEIKPLVGPTKDIMSVRITNIQWPEFYPRAWNKLGVMIALWAPIIFVYFIDMQIWYALFSTIFGCMYGAFRGLGEIRTLAMVTVRFHFKSLPRAFNAHLIPKGRRVPKNENKASSSPKIQLALLMISRSDGKEHELKNIVEEDQYMSCAIMECYASLKNIIMLLVQGERERMAVNKIFQEVDKQIESRDLFSEAKKGALLELFEHLKMLIKYLLVNVRDDMDEVTNLFRDMFEVVTRYIITEDNAFSLFRFEHEEAVPFYVILFASAGAIKFPISPITEAWKEKGNCYKCTVK